MSIKAERLEVEVTANTKPAEKGLDQFDDKTGKSSGGMKALQTATVGFAAAAAAGIAGKAVMAASDLNETVSKTGVVFKDQTGAVTGYAQDMADKFGLPKAAVLDAASSFGLLGKAAGLQGKELSSMSTGLATLAADATSFYNVPLDQALADFGSALSGESEPVKKYGVLMNEAAVEAEALALGLLKPTVNADKLRDAQVKARDAQAKYTAAVKEHGPKSLEAEKAEIALQKANDAVTAATKGKIGKLTEGQKVQARASLLAKGMADANGDLARTQESVSNRLREVQGRVINYSAAIGTKALPAVAGLLTAVIGLMDNLTKLPGWIDKNSTALSIVGGLIATILLPRIIAWGVQSTIAGAKSVAAWVASQASAIASSWAHVGAAVRVVGGWVMMGAAAVKSGAQTVAIWALYKAEAIKAAAVSVAQMARMTAATVAGFVAQAAAATANMARIVATTVAGWVLMGTQSLIQAARMAAAWVIAMGPVGWVIAAVIALAVIIYKNWDTIVAATKKAWTAIVGWLKGAWDWIKKAASATWNGIKTAVSTVLNVLKSLITAYFTAYRTVIMAVWNGIKSATSAAVNGVKSIVSSAWNWIKSVTSSAWNSVRSAVSNAVSGVLSVVRGIPGRIRSALGNLHSMLYNAGASIIRGLANGIRDGLGNVTGAVKGVLKAARDLLPFSPAKTGPFSGRGWTLYSGRSISSALAKGMHQRRREVTRAALSLAQSAVPRLAGITAPGVAFGAASRAGRADSGGARVTPDSIARQSGPSGSQTVVFNTYYPVAEKQSQTVNRSLQKVAALQTA